MLASARVVGYPDAWSFSPSGLSVSDFSSVQFSSVAQSCPCILKGRDITLPTKVHLVKPMVFPVVMYGCELDYKET